MNKVVLLTDKQFVPTLPSQVPANPMIAYKMLCL